MHMVNSSFILPFIQCTKKVSFCLYFRAFIKIEFWPFLGQFREGGGGGICTPIRWQGEEIFHNSFRPDIFLWFKTKIRTRFFWNNLTFSTSVHLFLREMRVAHKCVLVVILVIQTQHIHLPNNLPHLQC